MRNLSGEEHKLLLIQFFDFLSYSLVGVFVTVFFYSHSDLKTTIFYNIINMISMTFFYGLSGWTLKKVSSGFMMKGSFLVAALFYFILFFLREKSVDYILPLGILGGFSGGNFWAAFNLNQYILSHSGRRVEYFGWGAALVNLANALGPIVGGWIISFVAAATFSLTAGYVTLFFVVFSIMVAAVILIGKLPSHEVPQFSYRHFFEHQRSRRWKLVLGQWAVFGLYDVALVTITGVLFYLAVGEESQLGFLLTIGALLAMVASIVSIRVLKRFQKGYWVGAVGLAFALSWFALFQTLSGVWVFLVVSSLAWPFLLNALSVEFFNAIDAGRGLWQNKYHMILEQQVALGIFRIISYIGLFILLQFGNEITLARAWLFMLPLLPLAIGVLLQKTLYSSS